MGRREPKVRDTRERVLVAALAEFAERGLQAASVEDIAARAGLTKGAVYYYFSDKHDLAADLQAQLWERLGREANRDIDPAAGTLENLERAFGSFLAALQDEAEARFFLRDCWATPALEVAGRREHESGVGLVRRHLAAGIESGELAAEIDADAAARVLLGVFAEATLHILTSGQVEATMEVVVRMIHSLAAPDRARRPRRFAVVR
jgi:TetR/AcrR family acrAB operon transcriptional repressor